MIDECLTWLPATLSALSTLMSAMRSGLLLLFFGCSCLAAQTYKAKQIDFSQPGPFTQQQLEQCVGLHPGSSFTKAELAAAAQRLIDSGYFEDVAGALAGNVNAVTVRFDIKPLAPSRLIPVSFENFVWLTHDEVKSAVKNRFPLFIDLLPEGSPHQEEIRDALVDALKAKSITAKVAYNTFEPTVSHPQREIGFHVVKPLIQIANIKLTGVTPELVPFVQKSVNATARTRYTEGPADETTAEHILAPLLDAGYVQAKLTDVTLAPSAVEADKVSIVLNAKLDPGPVFRVSSLSFAGTPLISSQTFNAEAKLHVGEVASHRALVQSFTSIDEAYRCQGYMDVVIHAEPLIDVPAQQVGYTITVLPGEQYRVHTVTAVNLDPAARAEFERGFLMKEGSLYNPQYVADFLKNNTALLALAHYSAGYKAVADPSTHTVELTLTFAKGGGR